MRANAEGERMVKVSAATVAKLAALAERYDFHSMGDVVAELVDQAERALQDDAR